MCVPPLVESWNVSQSRLNDPEKWVFCFLTSWLEFNDFGGHTSLPRRQCHIQIHMKLYLSVFWQECVLQYFWGDKQRVGVFDGEQVILYALQTHINISGNIRDPAVKSLLNSHIKYTTLWWGNFLMLILLQIWEVHGGKLISNKQPSAVAYCEIILDDLEYLSWIL